MTDFGYRRTSTGGQDGDGQLWRLTQEGIAEENIFTDLGVSGMKASRPEWDRLLRLVERGDRITVTELSRVGRNVVNVLGVVDELERRGVALRILGLGLDFGTPVGRLVLSVLASVARLERDFISERTRNELAARKAAGVRLGAPKKLSPDQVTLALDMKRKGANVADVAKMLGCGQSTLYAALKEARVAEVA